MISPNSTIPKYSNNLDNKEITVSVLCLAYNHKGFIRQALEGFLMQQCSFLFEILVHDDASTDGTSDIIREYEQKYPGIIKPIYQAENQFSQKKINVTQLQRNRAIGKYIALCEGDDYWTDPNKLQKQVDFLEDNPGFAMCFHRSRIENHTDDYWKDQTFGHLREKEYTGWEILSQWTIPTASVMYRTYLREFIDSMARPKGILYTDILVYLTLAEHGRLYCLGDTMSVYRIHPYSMVHQRDDRRPMKYITHLKTIQKMFGGKYKHATDDLIADRYLTLAVMDVKAGNWTSSPLHVYNAVKYDAMSPVKRLVSFMKNKWYKYQKRSKV
ncbi:MAG: glycosyltransferase [Saprospiraceae bacterium]|jgi:glycosyltransferase involved in cell wall biosynthesis|nr:glycosyltransferase [Saprospiraceae bacterium]